MKIKALVYSNGIEFKVYLLTGLKLIMYLIT